MKKDKKKNNSKNLKKDDCRKDWKMNNKKRKLNILNNKMRIMMI